MPKKKISFRADRSIVSDVERLERSGNFNNRTEIYETALEKGLRYLKKNSLSKR